MLSKFLNFIKSNSLVEENDKILLSVSGGRDSVALCMLFCQAGIPFDVAHCNYHLRNNESNRDEAFVRTLCSNLNINLLVAQFDTPKFANDNKLSVEMAARQLRYDWYSTLCNKYHYSKIATAHHLNDQTETFFINLLRTTGINGICGIPVKRPLNSNLYTDKLCFIIRPLLFASRKDIDIFTKNVDYVDDYTNFSDKILRNFIRLNILPKFEDLCPDFPSTLQKSLTQFDCSRKLLSKLIEKDFPLSTDNHGNTLITIPDYFSQDELRGYLYFNLNKFDFNLTQIYNISQSIHSIGSIFNSGNYTLLVDRQYLIVRDINSFPLNADKSFFIDQNTKEIFEPLHLTFETIPALDINSLKVDNTISLLDFDKLSFPIEISTKRNGDFFYPLGMNKKKKLSDFYIDEKFDLFTKYSTFAARCKSDIICVIGHRIDNRYKVTENTKLIYKIKLI